MYDVVYSVLAHESPECVVDLIENILAFHPTLRVGIMFHTNPTLAVSLIPKLQYPHVWIHPTPFEKTWSSYSLFLGHIQNILWLQNQGITTRFLCLVASNCMFHRPVTLEFLEAKYAESDDLYVPTAYMPPIPEWAQTYQVRCNGPFFQFFHELAIPFVNSYHEGILLPWDIAIRIATFRDWNAMRALITVDFSFEEVLFSSLHWYFTGRHVRSLCTMQKIELETLHEIQNPCIKTVPRQYDHPIRIYLRKETRKYKDPQSTSCIQ
jgi:hypothetical protein